MLSDPKEFAVILEIHVHSHKNTIPVILRTHRANQIFGRTWPAASKHDEHAEYGLSTTTE